MEEQLAKTLKEIETLRLENETLRRENKLLDGKVKGLLSKIRMEDFGADQELRTAYDTLTRDNERLVQANRNLFAHAKNMEDQINSSRGMNSTFHF